MDSERPENDPYEARIADECGRLGISRERWEAYQRAEAERDRRDPKAPTWGLLLLYPVAAYAILIGVAPPGMQVGDAAQWMLTIIGGVWISWVSVRLLIRERHRYRVWVHYVLGVLAAIGVFFAVTGNEIQDGWLLTMGDPSQCAAEDRVDLKEGLKLYGDAVGDSDSMRHVAHYLDNFVRYGCISIADLEKQKADIERKYLARFGPAPQDDQSGLP